MSKHPTHNLAFLGAGYVGLVSGTCLADIGHHVILVDKDAHKIDNLKHGKIPIYEPGLAELVKKNVDAGRLSFTTSVAKATEAADTIFIAVGTPSNPDGTANLSYVEAAAQEIAAHADAYKVIVNKSTVPVTTGERVSDILQKHNSHHVDFDVVSNPEFLREGSAIDDFMTGDRVVIGANNDRARKIMDEIYAPLDMPVFFTDVKSAELIKYASNSFLATKISFINAVARICEITGGNIDDVAHGMGLDQRIGKHFLKAGIGYGGSCFPKDVSAFVTIARQHGYDFNLLQEVENINNQAREAFFQKISHALGDKLQHSTIALWGLAFKPNTDDMRCAPAIDISAALHKAGATIQAYDPEALHTGRQVIGDHIDHYVTDKYDALQNADALVILTEWPEFADPDWNTVRQSLNNPIVLDGRNLFDPQTMEEKGFVYHSIGRN